jgi:FkbM family methyltransferase
MLLPLPYLINKYNIIFNGIIHIGAHECEELRDYERYINRYKVLWIEGQSDKVEVCKNKYPGILIENAVVSDKVENVTFNISNNGQSSSILELGLHATYHPEVHYTNSYQVQTQTLNDMLKKYDNIPFNFINLDIQGAELKVLKGMDKYLDNIKYIYTEINSDYVYKDCNLVGEIDDYLLKYNFKRVETYWTEFKWGDALYIKL